MFRGDLTRQHNAFGLVNRERPQKNAVHERYTIVVAPMPSASVAMATAAKPGDLTSARAAYRTS